MSENELENSEADDGEFYFETDHLALRSNKDYCNLLKYIVKLEEKKVAVLQDIEYLAQAQSEALENPLKFVKDLNSDKINLPPRQTIPDLPQIDWNKYGIDLSTDDEDSTIAEEDNSTKVRGRKFTDSKPETFNQLWSCEEQKRLEELLIIYPWEPVNTRRYKKISEALGTRTPLQVMSRVQKYFAKLAKAGLPIPGKIPKKIVKSNSHNHSMFYKKSTFFPQLHVPVRIDEASAFNNMYDRSLSVDAKNGNKNMLELLKAAKEQRLLDETSPVYQNIMCVGCHKTGFLGARWTDNAGTDYCTDCIIKLLPAETLIPIRAVS